MVVAFHYVQAFIANSLLLLLFLRAAQPKMLILESLRFSKVVLFSVEAIVLLEEITINTVYLKFISLANMVLVYMVADRGKPSKYTTILAPGVTEKRKL